MFKAIAIVAALEREVWPLIRHWKRVSRQHEGRSFTFFEDGNAVLICGGIGAQAARRAAEAVIALFYPARIYSVGFAGALDATLHAGEIFVPALILDARDGSRIPLEGGHGTLITFMEVAGAEQKARLAQGYAARAIDMEAAAVAVSAAAHSIPILVVKAISDEVNFEIPHSSGFIDSEGHFKTASFILFAALRPWFWTRVGALARNTAKAARALSAHLRQVCDAVTPVAAPAPQAALASGGRE